MKPIVQVTLILVALLISISLNTSHSHHQRIEIQLEDPIDNGEAAKSTIIVDYTESSPAKIKYSNSAAIEYAKKFARQETNSCGKFLFDPDPAKNMSDCAHFVAHCLKAGGIEIKRKNSADPALCPDGLTYRNTELVAALQELATKFQNVKKIDIKDAIIGDFGFFNKLSLTRPTHAFMVCKTAVDPKDYTVYAHTRNRNCEKMEPSWMDFYDVAFRMEDGP